MRTVSKGTMGRTRLRRWADGLAEAHELFPTIAITSAIALVVIWSVTISLTRKEFASAAQAAFISSDALAHTYEAQVLPALREIDQTLNLVKFEYERRLDPDVLDKLDDRGLLPPLLLVSITIADPDGKVLANRSFSGTTDDATDTARLQPPPDDGLSSSKPERTAAGEWRLSFSRRLTGSAGQFAGVVTARVYAAYFVSDYDRTKLGDRGVLALLDYDGVFLARRTGHVITAGDATDYTALAPAVGVPERAFLAENPWDGERRFTNVAKLFEFPFLVMAGLSEDEQLTAAREISHVYYLLAIGGSILVLIVSWILCRTSLQLDRLNQRLIKANAAKTLFIRMAKHDLVTPVVSIGHLAGALANTLEPRTLSTEARQGISRIEDSVLAVQKLLAVLLDVSVIHGIGISALRIAELLDDMEVYYRPEAERKGLRLRIRRSTAVILSDREFLRRVLMNLIANAIRYTDKGMVLVGCRRRGETLDIQVLDTGIGIPEDKLEAIFEENVQLSNPEHDGRKGSGLGLAVVDRIVSELGHRVTVRSEVGTGSVFSVNVPLADSADFVKKEVSSTEVLSPDVSGAGRCYVMVIDDNRADLDTMMELLANGGFLVEGLSSTDEAVDLVRDEGHRCPDAIVIDYRLGGGRTGPEAIDRIRGAFNQHIPAILVTGGSIKRELTQSAEARGCKVLSKSGLTENLCRAVAELVN
jgi:signal transduction histidine kinase/ActR/RegA family two-component response regulator